MPTACEKMRTMSGGKVLDVATGGGEFIRVLMRLLQDCTKFVGIDSSDRQFEAAAKAFGEEPVSFETMDASNLTYDDESFDTVAISNSLHHLPDRDRVLAEMMRVLRPDGNFIVREMVCDLDPTPSQQNHIDLHHWWAKIDMIRGIHHTETYTRDLLDEIINALPLRNVESYPFTFPVEDPHQPEMIEHLLSMIDPYVERIREHPDYPSLKEQGEQLKSRLSEHGYAPATMIFYIGTK